MSKIHDFWIRNVCGSGDKGITFKWNGILYWLELNELYNIWVLLEIQNEFPIRGIDAKHSNYESFKISDKTLKEIFQTLEKEDLTVVQATPLHWFWTYLYGYIENVSFLFKEKWYHLEYDGIDPKKTKEEDLEPDTSFRLYLPDSKDSRDYIYFDSVEELLNSHVISPSKTVQEVLLKADHIHFT